MTNPLVSIITPTYNHELYIIDCIRSVQEQTYTNWEMIIIDDGSTDHTYNVAKLFSENDTRIKIFTQENKGIFKLSETYNYALQKATGKYIAVLEGDDIWFPMKLALQVESLELDNYAVLSWGQAFGSSIDLKENYFTIPSLKYNESVFKNSPVKSALKELIFVSYIPALTVLIRKTALEKTEGFIQKFGLPLVDLPTWQALATIGTFTYIDTPIGKWRTSPNQATKTYILQLTEGVYKLAIELLESNRSVFMNENINDSKIHRHFKNRLIVNNCKTGYFKLERKDYKGAKSNFNTSIWRYGMNKPAWKIRSIIGLIKTAVK